MKLKPQIIQVESGTVILKVTNHLFGADTYELFVQILDAYRYQREWILTSRAPVFVGSAPIWNSHAYMHPDFRNVQEITNRSAEKILTHFLDITTRHPALLFNVGNQNLARNEGFVHFHNLLLAGYKISAKLI